MNAPHISFESAPLRDAQPVSETLQSPGSDPAPPPARRSLNVLCIDDDESILDFMKNCLAHFGHEVRVASGGKYGIELFSTAMLKSEPFDVVVTDLGMPDVNGYQVAKAIRAESPDTPVVMMTGEGLTRRDGGALAAVAAVINKPPHIHELNELLLRVAAGKG